MVQLISRSIFGFLVATLFAPLCDAQTNVGRISGSVQDASGASVPGTGACVGYMPRACGIRGNTATPISE